MKAAVSTASWHEVADPDSRVFIPDNKDALQKELQHLDIHNRVTETASHYFGMDLYLVDNMGGFQLRKPGDSMQVHTDAENFRGVLEVEEVLHLNFAKAMTMYVALLYVGEDFGEGQLYFPNHELDIDVEPGALVMFPTSNKYPHGVREVTHGSRCVLSLYFTRKRLHDSYMDMFRLVSTHSDYAKDR